MARFRTSCVLQSARPLCPAEQFRSWGESWESSEIIHSRLKPPPSLPCCWLLFSFEKSVFFLMNWLTRLVFRGPPSQTPNVCVKEADLSFTSMVRLYRDCVWLRKGLVFLTHRDLCLFFFFFFSRLTFPLEKCQSMCNPIPLFTRCWKSYTSSR